MPPVVTSSGLHALGLADVRERVVRYLESERSADRLEMSDAQIEHTARIAMLAVNDPLAGVHRAGVALGRVGVCLALGISPPDGPEHAYCPRCGGEIVAP